MPCARATGRDWRRVWLTAKDQTLSAEDQALTAEDQTLITEDQALTAEIQALTAENQALYSASVQPNAAATTSGTKILAFCYPFS